MASLVLQYSDFQAELAHFLGWGATTSLSVDQKAAIDRVIQSGLRQFYYPPPIDESGEPYEWTFLRKRTTLTVAGGTNPMQLPEDFAGGCDQFTRFDAAEETEYTVPVLAQDEWERVRAGDPQTGAPLYATIRAQESDGSAEQRFEVEFWPAPENDATYVLVYSSLIRPPKIDLTTVKYPLGGAEHSETILASCLAVAERRYEDQTGPRERDWKERLASSIRQDQRARALGGEGAWTHDDDEPETLGVSYQRLRQRVGGELGFGWNPTAWTQAQVRRVDAVLDDGLRQFYWPPPLSDKEEPHGWSFMRKRTTVAVTTTGLADLATDYAGGCREFIQESPTGNERVIPVVDPDYLLALRTNEPQTAANPLYAAVRAKEGDGSAEQRYEVLVYPTPTATVTLRYGYTFRPWRINSTNLYPLGGAAHAGTIVASCLAFLEEDPNGPRHLAWKTALTASIQADRTAESVSTAVHPIEDAPTTLAADYGTLMRRTGHFLGFGWVREGWTHEQAAICDAIVQEGVRLFYTPPPVQSGGKLRTRYTAPVKFHQWSFLQPTTSLALGSGSGDYSLPDDYGSLARAFTFSPEDGQPDLRVVDEWLIRHKRQTAYCSGRPTLVAIRPKEAEGTARQRFEALFWPIPDAEYTVYYGYSVYQGPLSDTNLYPAGGDRYAQVLIESCLAAAERWQGKVGIHTAAFDNLLSAAVMLDERENTPDYFGNLYEDRDQWERVTAVTVNGTVPGNEGRRRLKLIEAGAMGQCVYFAGYEGGYSTGGIVDPEEPTKIGCIGVLAQSGDAGDIVEYCWQGPLSGLPGTYPDKMILAVGTDGYVTYYGQANWPTTILHVGWGGGDDVIYVELGVLS